MNHTQKTLTQFTGKRRNITHFVLSEKCLCCDAIAGGIEMRRKKYYVPIVGKIGNTRAICYYKKCDPCPLVQ